MEVPAKGISFRGIRKDFGDKTVLADINLDFEEGLVHAIVGENGAGKSTLMNLLCGVHAPSAGGIFIDGEEARLASPRDAVKYRLGMIHQHFMMIDTLAVWQNIILGNEPRKRGLVDRAAAKATILRTCEEYGMEVPLDTPVGCLTVGQQQRVEILKVLCQDAHTIIFDEPTAVLTPAETRQLLASIRQLKARGKTILFISHKLEEVTEVADTVTVLRGGHSQGKTKAGDITQGKTKAGDITLAEMVQKMVGREVDLGRRPAPAAPGGPVLEVRGVSLDAKSFGCGLHGVDLCVHAGEIVGIAGVDGNGQQELVDVLLGLEKPREGTLRLAGEDVTGRPTAWLRQERIACIPPDRHHQGLVLGQSVLKNALLGCEGQKRFKKGPFLSPGKARGLVSDKLAEYGVCYGDVQQPIGGLSGGNQQKVILLRECEWKGTQLILAVNPTRGLDIGAMEFVYGTLNRLKEQGRAILLISTELSEITTLADRIAVLYEGGIMGVLDNTEDLDIERVGAYMAGITGGMAGIAGAEMAGSKEERHG